MTRGGGIIIIDPPITISGALAQLLQAPAILDQFPATIRSSLEGVLAKTPADWTDPDRCIVVRACDWAVMNDK